MPVVLLRAAILIVCAVLAASSSKAQQPGRGVYSVGEIDWNPIPGHPYSAVREVEESSVGPGGIHRIQFQIRLYRDAAGRERYELSSPSGRLSSFIGSSPVDIEDPITQIRYSLESATHVASYYSISPPKPPPLPPERSQNVYDDVDQYLSAARAPYSKKVSEDLGTRTMEGVLARGERITWTLPAASAGQDRPLTKIDEVWTSDDAGIEMFSKHSDSRGGEIVSRVISLTRSEPDPTLFQVPADYTLQKAQ